MKKLSNIAMFCCIATTLILASCSNSTTTTVADKNYFPLTVGNTWVYDGVETEDKSGTATPVSGTEYTKTTRVDAALTYQGKSAYRLIDVNSDGSKDSTYISKSGSQMYSFISLSPGNAGGGAIGGVDFGSRWMLVADFNAASWNVLDTNIANIPIDLGGGATTTGKAAVKITGTKGSMSSITVGSETVQAQEFIMTIGITMTITVPFLGDQVIPINLINKTYVAENIGIVKTEQLPFTLNALGTPQANNGSRETLKSYTVIK